jgi:hypothetical protein
MDLAGGHLYGGAYRNNYCHAVAGWVDCTSMHNGNNLDLYSILGERLQEPKRLKYIDKNFEYPAKAR